MQKTHVGDIPFARMAAAMFALFLSACASNAGPSPASVEATPKEAASGPVGWHTVFFDDFDGTALDETKWKPEQSCWGGGNQERQCYTDLAQNVRVTDGELQLVAIEGDHTGPLYPEGMPGAPGGTTSKPYTSGKVRTRGLAAYRYGRISARLMLPEGQGTWPAFWMMPETDAYGPWPLSGEIDIMEATNLGTPCDECEGGIERRTSGALHFGERPPDNTYWYAMADFGSEVNPASEWRTYTVEWAEGTIQWLVDDRIFLRLDEDDWYTASADARGRPYAPFDQAFYLMLNLAVGGTLTEKNGGGFDADAFPATLRADWIRVEQCAGDLETGRACLTNQPWDGTALGPWEDKP
ncbi:MAG: glycoside hydrolase family 16 protein [Litorimonas sp.]